MKKFILATKQSMTEIFDEDGRIYPATILSVAQPVTVTQIKKSEGKDGYDAVQIGSGSRKEKNINKAQRKKGSYAILREFKGETEYSVGDTIDVSVFAKNDTVSVSAISKGKGFQGVVKRYGFAGGPRSHGQKHSERAPGSIGATGPQRVLKGTRMGGRMGGRRITVKNLKILSVDPKERFLIVSGAVPGRKGTAVEVRSKK